MYYIIYRIINTVNGKDYIGCHKTTDIHDEYMGSGKVLNRAINKYGMKNFQKEILHVFDTPEEMFEMESELVDEGFVSREDTYNIKMGGQGGWDYINGRLLSQSKAGKVGGKVHADRMKSDFGYRQKVVETASNNLKKSHKEGKMRYDGFKGRNHTEESKKKIGEANSIHQKGSKNHQYGTMWITNEVESKKIRKDEEIPEGWRKGRKIK